jgi:asparagine synthase (glutamine-hydrolysing)
LCGISGILVLEKENICQGKKLSLMVQTSSHRGPDALGGWSTENLSQGDIYHDLDQIKTLKGKVFLGHTRLAIQDLSEKGVQPMCYDLSTWISFNGEIYNYKQLKKELEQKGYSFNTDTDTEVILASYMTWGVDCLKRFNGMFAFLLVDLRKKILFGARDRLGIKPFHYVNEDGCLLFASEIKQLVKCSKRSYFLNKDMAMVFLMNGIANHISDETMFKGIYQVKPGHYFIIDLNKPAGLDLKPYWHLEQNTNKDLTYEDAKDHFKYLFDDSIKLRLISDVPVGTSLSGGLDSSIIACTISGKFKKNINTFSACFNNEKYNEEFYLDLVNQAVPSLPNKIYPDPNGFIEEASDLFYHQEEPFDTLSAYAQWCVFREARNKNVLVLLDGQGGDELLFGYNKYYMYFLRDLLYSGKCFSFFKETFNVLFRSDANQFNLYEAKRYFPGRLRKCFSHKTDFKFINNLSDTTFSLLRRSKCRNVFELQKRDIHSFSIPALTRVLDRNSMAHAVEARLPFLDYRLVEFLVGINPKFMLRNGRTKTVMRDSVGVRLPHQVLNRQDKLSFVPPMVDWLKGPLYEWTKNQFNKESILDVFVSRKELVDALNCIGTSKQTLGEYEIFRAAGLVKWASVFNINVK